MFIGSFKTTGLVVIQLLLISGIGFSLVKRKILDDNGLNTLSKLSVEVTMPILIFCQLLKDFSFSLYPDWWIFPLISLLITLVGLIAGALFIVFVKGGEQKKQFLSLVAFQNSGYLPIALVIALLPKDKSNILLVYLFLFLLGFNLIIWSAGVHLMAFHREKRFELGSLFSPPVLATLISLGMIFLGLNKIIPNFIFKPLGMIGDCTVPFAMLVVGGNLAQVRLDNIHTKNILLMLIAKMIILPVFGLWLVFKFQLPELLGLLVVMQLAMPSATSLSVISRHYKKEDLLISHGIFFSHILSIITIPLFLGLYFAHSVLR